MSACTYAGSKVARMQTNKTLALSKNTLTSCLDVCRQQCVQGDSLRLTLWQPSTEGKPFEEKKDEFTMIKKCEELVVGVMNWFVELVELSMTRAKTVCPARSLLRPSKTSKCSYISNNSSCHVSNSASLNFFGTFLCVRA
jgi:hypothetical protein